MSLDRHRLPLSNSLSQLLFSFSSVCSCSPTVSSLFVHEYSRSSAEPGGRRGGVVDPANNGALAGFANNTTSWRDLFDSRIFLKASWVAKQERDNVDESRDSSRKCRGESAATHQTKRPSIRICCWSYRRERHTRHTTNDERRNRLTACHGRLEPLLGGQGGEGGWSGHGDQRQGNDDNNGYQGGRRWLDPIIGWSVRDLSNESSENDGDWVGGEVTRWTSAFAGRTSA